MYCKNCGHELKPGTQFCPACGTKTEHTKSKNSSFSGRKALFFIVSLILAAGVSAGAFKIANIIVKDDPRENWVAIVEENGSWYVIDGWNEKLAEIQLDDVDRIGDFNKYGIAYAYLNDESIAYINTEGDVLPKRFKPCEESYFIYLSLYEPMLESNWYLGLGVFEENGKYGFIDAEGNIVSYPVYDEVYGFSSNGLAKVRVGEKWGYVNMQGEVVIKPVYAYTVGFGSGELAMVKTEAGERYFIDEDGDIKINMDDYADINVRFNECGLCGVEIDGKWGCINTEGEIVIEPEYSQINIDDDYILAWDEHIVWMLDEQGEITGGPFDSDQITLGFRVGTAWEARDNGTEKYGIVNDNNEVIVDFAYDAYDDIFCFGEAGFMVLSEDDSKAQLFGENGELKGEWRQEYADEEWFRKIYNKETGEAEMCAVNTDGKWEFMDTQLEVPMKVKRGTYVSYNGETHTSEIDDISGGIGFAGSPIAVLIDYEWGYIDSKGRMMIPCQYTSAGTFFDRNVLEE